MKRRRSPELKFFDTHNIFNFDTTTEIVDTGTTLNAVPQGTGDSQRVGRQITIKSIEMTGVIQSDQTGLSPDTVAIWLVLDKQANGANPTVAQVVAPDPVDDTVPSLPIAHPNLENSDRFVLLRKWVSSTYSNYANSLGTPALPVHQQFRFYKKVDIPIDFDSSASTGVLGTIRSNNLILLASAYVNDSTIIFDGITRIRYIDS